LNVDSESQAQNSTKTLDSIQPTLIELLSKVRSSRREFRTETEALKNCRVFTETGHLLQAVSHN